MSREDIFKAPEGMFRLLLIDTVDDNIFPQGDHTSMEDAIRVAKERNKTRSSSAEVYMAVYDDQGRCKYDPEKETR